METPATINASFLGLVLFLFVALILGIRKGLATSPFSKLWLWIGTGVLAWMALLTALASVGFFAQWDVLPPPFMPMFPITLIAMLWWSRSASFQTLINRIPRHYPVYLQAFRIWIEVVLWQLFLEEILPEQMTFEGLNWDVLTGLSALGMGFLLAKTGLRYRKLAIAWNVMGLILVTTIVTIAVLSTPTSFRFFTEGPANEVIAHWPFVWLPGFVVPVAYLLHLISIKQLLSQKQG